MRPIRADVLDLARAAGERKKCRKLTVGAERSEVGQKRYAVSNDDLDIVCAPDAECHLVQRGRSSALRPLSMRPPKRRTWAASCQCSQENPVQPVEGR